jgi:hypothetical protein
MNKRRVAQPSKNDRKPNCDNQNDEAKGKSQYQPGEGRNDPIPVLGFDNAFTSDHAQHIPLAQVRDRRDEGRNIQERLGPVQLIRGRSLDLGERNRVRPFRGDLAAPGDGFLPKRLQRRRGDAVLGALGAEAPRYRGEERSVAGVALVGRRRAVHVAAVAAVCVGAVQRVRR